MNKKEINNVICFALFIGLIILLLCLFNYENNVIEGISPSPPSLPSPSPPPPFASNDATLSELEIININGTLNPVFNKGIYKYTLRLKDGTDETKVKATTSNSKAKLSIQGNTNATSDVFYGPIAINNHTSTHINIYVIAENNLVAKNYEVTILPTRSNASPSPPSINTSVYTRVIKKGTELNNSFNTFNESKRTDSSQLLIEVGDTLQLVIPEKRNNYGKRKPPPACGAFHIGKKIRKTNLKHNVNDKIYICSYKVTKNDLKAYTGQDGKVKYTYKKTKDDPHETPKFIKSKEGEDILLKIIKSTKNKLNKVKALQDTDCYIGIGSQYQGNINTWIDKEGNIKDCAHWDSKKIPTGKNIKEGIILPCTNRENR